MVESLVPACRRLDEHAQVLFDATLTDVLVKPLGSQAGIYLQVVFGEVRRDQPLGLLVPLLALPSGILVGIRIIGVLPHSAHLGTSPQTFERMLDEGLGVFGRSIVSFHGRRDLR